MIKLERPDLDTSMVFSAVVGTVGSSTMRTRYTACLPHVLQAEQEFEAKITRGLIYTIPTEEGVNNDLSAHAFKILYDQQMVAKDIGRVYYNKLLAAAPLGLCPLCGHRDVSTLDHYLPKALFPRLSVVPVNLVPACKDCNTDKLVSYPLNSEQETLHPYYDDIDGDLWLTMEVIQNTPVSILYMVQRPEGWSDLLLDRVVSHFDSFGLQKLYGIQAARELVGMKRKLTNLHSSGGAESVSFFLNDAASSWADARLNSWKTALYYGLSTDEWFCETGFAMIGG